MSPKPLLRRLLTFLAAAFLVVFLSGVLCFIIVVAWFSRGLPSAEELKNIQFTQSTVIMDRESNVLYTIHGEENRQVVPLKEISPDIVNATIAIEDQNFYHHYGFYPKRIIGATVNNLLNRGKTQGASTITQQFVKNNFLSSAKTITRKTKELILAVRLEMTFSKEQILEMYLNKIPYGNNAYGIERAAQVYFQKNAKDLTLAESAILAALPQAPSYYNPYGQHRFSLVTTEFDLDSLKKRNIQQEEDLNLNEISRGLLGHVNKLDDQHQVYIRGRADIILREMYEMKFITAEQKKKAWEETQTIQFTPHHEIIRAPHFVLFIKDLLEKKYGKELVEKGGLKVYTTLDPKLQETAEKLITDKIEFNQTNYGAENAALLSVQPETGQILAMVGSADYYNEKAAGNVNIVTSKRQPGSSFKPFVYALTFLKRYSPASIVFDVETKFDGGDPPKNYEGKFYGPISIRTALGKSRNIPAIKAYFLAGEQKAIIPFVKKLGIDSLDPNFDYSWPLGIGSGEVTMYEMVQGYSVFANNGVKVELTPILKVEDGKGNILEQGQPDTEKEQVLDPQVAFLINNILSDQSVNLGHWLNIEGHAVAAKTGTSTKRIDKETILPSNAWIFGYTPKIVTSVWVGNSDGSAMKLSADGYNSSAPLWNAFMTEALKDQPAVEFSVPQGLTKVTVSKASGKLPSSFLPEGQTISDYFASFAIPTEIDNSFKEATVDTASNEIATPYCPKDIVKTKTFRIYQDIDPANERWAKGVKNWATTATGIMPPLPDKKCHLHNEATAKVIPTIQIISPEPYTNIFPVFTSVNVKIDAPHGVDRVEYYLDGKRQFTSKSSPYNGKIRLNRTVPQGSKHLIGVKIFDTLQYNSSTEITVIVSPPELNNASAADADNSSQNPPSDSSLPVSEEEKKDVLAGDEEPVQ